MTQTGSAVPGTPRIAIIGAGFAGIGAAIKLNEAGFNDVTVLERGDDVGGVWRDNTYPGCCVDIQSRLYEFSFAKNPRWTRAFSTVASLRVKMKTKSINVPRPE